jgi:hypothetical protein
VVRWLLVAVCFGKGCFKDVPVVLNWGSVVLFRVRYTGLDGSMCNMMSSLVTTWRIGVVLGVEVTHGRMLSNLFSVLCAPDIQLIGRAFVRNGRSWLSSDFANNLYLNGLF